MICGRLLICKPNYRRGDERVVELNVRRIITMNAQQGYGIEQIFLNLLPVIYIHKLARYEPAGSSAGSEPGVTDCQEIAVKAGQTVKPHAGDCLG